MMRSGEKTLKFQLTITAEMNERILEWRKHQDDIPVRNEAVRRLLERGLQAAEEKQH